MTQKVVLPQMLPVQSAHLTEIGYADGKLYVRFINGAVYAYNGVPETEYKHLLSAESIGKTFHNRIKGKYEDEIVEFPF